jgi:hypothetical protein
MSLPQLQADEIRQLVRSILREIMPTATQTGSTREQIAIRSDDDLNRFVQRLWSAFDDPVKREAIRSGTMRFTLSAQDISAPDPFAKTPVAALSGAISERKLLSVAKAGDTVAIAADAVITPLARDKARALNITLIRRG